MQKSSPPEILECNLSFPAGDWTSTKLRGFELMTPRQCRRAREAQWRALFGKVECAGLAVRRKLALHIWKQTKKMHRIFNEAQRKEIIARCKNDLKNNGHDKSTRYLKKRYTKEGVHLIDERKF